MIDGIEKKKNDKSVAEDSSNLCEVLEMMRMLNLFLSTYQPRLYALIFDLEPKLIISYRIRKW